ncbi:hypothetical protein V8G54_018906, partial [Vigna mungo]
IEGSRCLNRGILKHSFWKQDWKFCSPSDGFILQGNTYVHRNDVGNPEEEDEDQEMDDVQDEAGPSTLASVNHFYSLKSLSRQLFDMSLLQASRHEEVCSLLRGLNGRIHSLEGLVQPLDVDYSDES